ILGFATNEQTQKLEFNGYLNLELNNNLNFGEQFIINYKADGQEQVNFRAKITLPYLLKTPFGVSGELKIFKRDSTFITTAQEIRARYQINPTSTTYIGYKGYDSSNLLDEVIAGTPVEEFKSKFFVLGATYLKSQNRTLIPIKTQFVIDTGIGARVKESKGEDQLFAGRGVNNIFNLNYKNSI